MREFLEASAVESFQNLSLVLGFILSAKTGGEKRENQIRSAVCIIGCMITGSLLIYMTETKITGQDIASQNLMSNAVIFSALGLFGYFYITRVKQPRSDFLTGSLMGVAMAVGQGIADRTSLIGVIVHSLAMVVACSLLLAAVRWIVHKSWVKSIAWGTTSVVLVSIIIVAIDYTG